MLVSHFKSIGDKTIKMFSAGDWNITHMEVAIKFFTIEVIPTFKTFFFF